MAHVDMSLDTLTGSNTLSRELQTYLNLPRYCIGSGIPVTFFPTAHGVFRNLPAAFRHICDTELRGRIIDLVRAGFPDQDQSRRFRELPSANELAAWEIKGALLTLRSYLKPRDPGLWRAAILSVRAPPHRRSARVVDPSSQPPIAYAEDRILMPQIVLPYFVVATSQRVEFVRENIVFEGPNAAAIRLALSLDHLWHAGSNQWIILRRSTTNTVYRRIGDRWVTIGNTGTCQDRGYDTEAQEFESECINLERLRWGRERGSEQARNANRAPNDGWTSIDLALPPEDHIIALSYPWYIIPPETRVYSERRVRTYNRPQTITFRYTAPD